MNEFDILMLFLLILGAFWGAFRGVRRQAIALLSVWLSLVASLWLYKWFAREILGGVLSGVPTQVLDSFSFIVLMIVFSFFINLIVVLTNKSPEERRKKQKKQDLNELLDKMDNQGPNTTIPGAIGGFLLGLLSSLFWLSLLTALLQFMAFNAGMMPAIASSMRGSTIMIPILNMAVGLIYLSVSFFTPGGLPTIFSAIL